jgi:hypothetical protein
MSEEDLETLNEVKLKRLHNLRMFQGKTDEDIREFYRNRKPKPTPVPSKIPAEVFTPTGDEKYDKSFKTKLKLLQAEYGIDMNNSNDAELLSSLVRHIIQQENVNSQIIQLQQEEEVDTRTLKNLGDFQRTLVTSITDMQEKLGIARKLRKEKQIDDVATFFTDLKKRGKAFFDIKTTVVWCETCRIELARYWLNFPDSTKAVHFEITCWKCDEGVIYTA